MYNALSYAGDGVAAILVAISLFVFPSTVPQIFCKRPFGKWVYVTGQPVKSKACPYYDMCSHSVYNSL